jgi:hypothetical protein
LVLQFIAGYNCAPASITLDLDHTDDATYGQQPLSFYNHHYGHYCYLPLLVFEAGTGALVTAVLRPGKRPTGNPRGIFVSWNSKHEGYRLIPLD